MEIKTLEQKLNEEFGKHRFSPLDLEQLLKIAKTNAVISDLFKEFSTNPKLFRLLTLHRLDLFVLQSDIKSSLFLYCNLPKTIATGEKNQVSNALKFIVSERIDKSEENGLSFLNTALGNIDEISADFKDIICYFIISLLRANPSILELASAKDFNYGLMKAKVKNYDGTIELNSFIEATFSQYGKNVDPEIRKKIEKIAIQIASNLTGKVEQTIDGITKIAPDLTMLFHKQSVIWLSLILQMTELNFDDYTNCLDFLFRIKAIENKHIVTWCESCNKHEQSFELITGKIAPSNLKPKRVCIQCQNNKNYSFSAVYGLFPALKDILNSKDGILAVYFAWLLDKKGRIVECSKYAGEFETDILIDKKYLVECKLFKKEKDHNAIITNAKKSLSQLGKQIEKFEKEGVIIEKAFLLWNIDVADKDLRDELDLTYKSLREKYGCKIITYNEVQEFVNGLR